MHCTGVRPGGRRKGKLAGDVGVGMGGQKVRVLDLETELFAASAADESVSYTWQGAACPAGVERARHCQDNEGRAGAFRLTFGGCLGRKVTAANTAAG